MSYPMKNPTMERKPDGALYRVTPKQHREAVRISNERCCDSGSCRLTDDGDKTVCCTCIQTSRHQINLSVYTASESGGPC